MTTSEYDELLLAQPRHQAFLREMELALDAMKDKALTRFSLVTGMNKCCAVGSVWLARGLTRKDAARLSICQTLNIDIAALDIITFQNDFCSIPETPGERWTRMREWVAAQIKKPNTKNL